MTFTIEELITVLTDAQTGRPNDVADAWTLRELVAQTGQSPNALKRAIELLQAEGRIEVTRKPYRRIDGMISPVAAYRLK